MTNITEESETNLLTLPIFMSILLHILCQYYHNITTYSGAKR